MTDADEMKWKMDVVEKLTTLTNKIDAIHVRMDEVVGRQKDLNRRVDAIERARIYGKGWIAGAMAICGIIGGFAVEALRRFFGM